MSETSENPTVRSSTATAPAPAGPAPYVYKTPKVFKAAAWVAIVAGIVFVVSVIFFTGMKLAHHGGHHHHHKHHAAAFMHHRMGGPGGPGGQFGPPQAPQGAVQGGPAAGTPGPSQIPSSVAPAHTP